MQFILARYLTVLFIALFSTSILFAQKAGEWNGLTIDVSTPEDAVRLFGAPAKEAEKTSLKDIRLAAWLSARKDEKVFRTLFYKNLKDNKSVQLSFLDDKLVWIMIETGNPLQEEGASWVDPDDLNKLFGADFRPFGRKWGRKRLTPAEFEAAPTELKKSEYDYWYDMTAVTENSFIIAVVDNYKHVGGGFFDAHAEEKKKRKAMDEGGKYPGYVREIQIISRKLAA